MTDYPSLTINSVVHSPLVIWSEGKKILEMKPDGSLVLDPCNVHEAATMFVAEVQRLVRLGCPHCAPILNHDLPQGKHPSHTTRFSDSSAYDEVCTQCGSTDITGGGWGKLGEPCPNQTPPSEISHDTD